MHIVSNVEGDAGSATRSLGRAAQATIPAGTVSGAPKVRAMEIIDELRTGDARRYLWRLPATSAQRRHGHLASCIRTAIIKDGRLYVQAGAGIVADSSPDGRMAGTLNKARAILRAAEMAESGTTRDSEGT